MKNTEKEALDFFAGGIDACFERWEMFYLNKAKIRDDRYLKIQLKIFYMAKIGLDVIKSGQKDAIEHVVSKIKNGDICTYNADKSEYLFLKTVEAIQACYNCAFFFNGDGNE